MVIREVQEADLPALAELHVAAWQVAYRQILPAEFLNNLSTSTAEARWADLLEDARRTTLVAEVNGRVAGFVGFGDSRDEDDDPHVVGEIYAVYVHPEFWGQGAGTALVRQAINQLQDRGLREVTVWTLTENALARAFYEKMGFTGDNATKRIARPEVTFNEVRYRRQTWPRIIRS
ncbi:MAG: GNAT family N-acetyltransferase [Chloroflexota bacterium]